MAGTNGQEGQRTRGRRGAAAKLLKEIESHADMSVVLEISASSRSMCRAGQDCFHLDPSDYRGYADIHDEFRIRVNGVRGELSHWRTTHFYHILCFAAMMDVERLIPSKKFTFERGPGWGLMVMKWEMHRGRVNLDVLAKFIDEMEQWEERSGAQYLYAAAGFGIADRDEDTSPTRLPAATPETKPVLQNYITNFEGGANLWELMKQPSIWKGKPFIVSKANGPKFYGPWAETWEEDPLPEESDSSNQQGDTADTTSRPSERLVNSLGLSLYKLWDIAWSNREESTAADEARSQDARFSKEINDGSSHEGGSQERVQETEKINKKRGGHDSSGTSRVPREQKREGGDTD